MRKKIRIGISACLIGLKYRYDGSSKFNPEIVEALRDHVEFVPVCPEVECGLDVPRPPIRLETSPRGIRPTVIDTGEDLSKQMDEWCVEKFRKLDKLDLAAFIFKSGSPSCGLKDVPVFNRLGAVVMKNSKGFFAKRLLQHYQGITVFEDTDFPEAAKWL